eukprot:CAMPEP_0118658674 /NCGR_PEP_ID=MMETSP0785-20121206/14698_1 /TAXON_ID=91992 /ORGANISM="Bolidomonas pacifica, Strain CCMP 1866" /LENGTH=567 /DNA_ID=CAMNT_0006551715 /DNA_START=717 /DNA_END=2416 /DNA_ORIENTATION=-
MTYYEGFDQKTGKPYNEKGKIPLQGVGHVNVAHAKKRFCWVIRHENRRPVYMSAENENEKYVWLESIEKASKIKNGEVKGKVDLTPYFAALKLNPNDNPTIKQIDRAYKKAALRAHPDKGGDPDLFKAVTDAYEIITSTMEEEEEAKKYKQVLMKATIKKGPPGVGFGMVVVEDPKSGDIVVKEVLDGLNVVGAPEPEDFELKAKDVVVGIGDDNIKGWPLTRVIVRLNNFRVPIGGLVKLTFSRKVNLDGSEIREDKPDLNKEDENPWDSTPMVPVPPGGEGEPEDDSQEQQEAFIPMPPDPYPNEKPDEGSVPVTRSKRASTTSKQVYKDDTTAMALKIQQLTTQNEDLEIELNETKEKLTLAQASLGSLKRQVEAAEMSAKDSADRAQHAEVEFQRVLLSTEEYHEARVKANVEVPPPESRLPPQTSAKTLLESRAKAIASVAATDPTGNMLRKWEREGESAEDKLKRLEARLANKGLLNVEKPGGADNKRVLQTRRASLASKLNPKSRQNREHLAAKGVMRKKTGMAHAQATIMKTKLNQKLKYRPNQNDLVKGGILRPGTTG